MSCSCGDGARTRDVTPRRAPTDTRLRDLAASLRGAEDTLRRVHRLEGAPIVDKAIEDGRIDREQRETWLRGFERSPETAKSLLSKLPPNELRAYASLWTDEDERLWRQWAKRDGLVRGDEELI